MLAPDVFAVFAPPADGAIAIEPTPRLESWMRKDHPDQVRLRAYLDWLEPRVSPHLATVGNALALTIAVPAPQPLDRGGSDLDNFLFPVVRRLGHARFVSAWAAKDRSERSSIAVGLAIQASAPDSSWHFASALTREPKDTTAWKHDIDAQVRAGSGAPVTGSVEVQISYLVDPRWNWSALWKPTIDALGAIVGEGSRPFNPRDDRIVRIGLHRKTTAASRPGTGIGVWWRAAPPTSE